MSMDNGWDGHGVAVAEPPTLTVGGEVRRLATVVDCLEAADDGERRRLLAYLVDRYGQSPTVGRGRR